MESKLIRLCPPGQLRIHNTPNKIAHKTSTSNLHHAPCTFISDWCKLYFGGKCSSRKKHVEFTDFLHCIIGEMKIEKSEFFGHVETSYSRCGVCDYPYNYVGKYKSTDASP